jgi:hypothetical protein
MLLFANYSGIKGHRRKPPHPFRTVGMNTALRSGGVRAPSVASAARNMMYHFAVVSTEPGE